MTFLAVASAALFLLTPQDIPRMPDPVVDLAGVLSPAQVQEARNVSLALEASDSTQVALLIVKTTGGKDIAEYALEVGRKNGFGKSGKNNGALIVVAVDDRRVRIEVGTGLEGKLTDVLASRIIRNEMVPHFKAGQFGEGSLAAMKAVAATVKGEYKGDPASPRRKKTIGWGGLLLLLIFLIFFSRRGGMGGFFTGYMLGGMLGGGGGRGGWGGGGGGGGWSGGGGSFGGGGASGSW
jgi:uncharacterized protein